MSIKVECKRIINAVNRLQNKTVTDKQQVLDQIDVLLHQLQREDEDDRTKIDWCIGRLTALKSEL